MAETKLTADELLGGHVRVRQGGDPDDFSIAGTTNYTEERINMQSQIGSARSSSAGAVTVTFATPYATPPHVLLSVVSGTFSMPVMSTITTTGFTFQVGSILGALLNNVQINWRAEGRRPSS